jgi:uncharacterized membrane protein
VADTQGRLDQPLVPKRTLRPTYDSESLGRFSERLARFLGTGRFLVMQSLVVLVWITYNELTPRSWRFDDYPFIFLTLVLSLQAAYAAPLILLAQNRQTDRDRANLVEDRQQAARALEDTEYLLREIADVRLSVGDVVTRDFLRDALRDLLDDLRSGDAAGADGAKKKKRKQPRREGPGEVSRVTEPQQPGSDHSSDLEHPALP